MSDDKDLEARIIAALHAAADTVHEDGLVPGSPPTAIPHRARMSWIAPVLAAAAVVAVAIGAAVVVNSSQDSKQVQAARTADPTQGGVPSHSAGPAPSGTSSGRAPTSGTPTGTGPSPAGAVNCYFIDFRCPVTSNYVYLQPLWPFSDYAQAERWEKVDGPAGHQPWHADAAETALLFTRNYLRFTDIDTVTGASIDANGQAHVGVGYALPSGAKHTAAVLHLVRFSSTVGSTTSGWEVVGSDDTDFSLEHPAYGSQVSSPMTVGGHITGVDENITVTVRSLSGRADRIAALPAGGTHSPWSETVAFSAKGVLTIVASTGGHLTQHERFAIQGVHT